MEFRDPMREVHLLSDSKRKAEYHLYLYELPHNLGYVIKKTSGPAGCQQPAEAWYRESLELAVKKFEGIVKQKTSRTKGRQYKAGERKQTAVETQLPLL